jgi:hypothetical protein
MYSLSIRVEGDLDDVSMAVTLQTPTINFYTTVFVSDREIGDQSAVLSGMSSCRYGTASETCFDIRFGPRLEQSPICAIAFEVLGAGKFMVRMDLRHAVTSDSYSALDKCTAHFITDVASLDAFASGLRLIAMKSTSRAELHGFY